MSNPKVPLSDVQPETEINPEDLYSLGSGFDRPNEPESSDKKTPEDASKTLHEVLVDGEPRIKAYVKDQLEKYPDSCTTKCIKAHVFDMKDTVDRETYGQYLTWNDDPDYGIFISDPATEFDKKTGNWKVMLVVREVNFLPILKPQKP